MRLMLRIGLALLALSPAAFTLALVSKYGVDIPYADEWTLAPILAKAHTHTLTFSDFFAQHNEHRYVFPKVLLIGFAAIARGDVRFEMLFSVLLCGLTSLNLWLILQRTFSSTPEKRLLLLTLLNLVLFSPVQAENWTWGFQFVLFLINFLLTTGIAVATSDLTIGRKFVICLAIALTGTFSFGNGFALWVTTFPLSLISPERMSRKRRLVWLAAWAAGCLGAISVSFINYVKPAHHPSIAASNSPLDYFLYVATFLGAHLSQAARTESIVVPITIGTLLLVIYFAGMGFALFRGSAGLLKQVTPWMAIGGFALASAFMAALTRIGFGINQGLDSRYTTFSLCLSIGIIGLAAIVSGTLHSSYGRNERFRRTYLRVETAFLTAFLIAIFISGAWGVESMKSIQRTRLWGKGACLLGNVLDDEIVYETYLGGWGPDVLKYANMEDAMGLLHPRLFRTAEISQLPRVTASKTILGYVDTVTGTQGSCEITGWAVHPKRRRVADCVVVAYQSTGHEPVIFGVADQVSDRPDVVEAFHKKELLRSGWTVHFQRPAVPRGEQHISAWSLDTRSGMFYELGSAKILP
jgi:hypothetical protein